MCPSTKGEWVIRCSRQRLSLHKVQQAIVFVFPLYKVMDSFWKSCLFIIISAFGLLWLHVHLSEIHNVIEYLSKKSASVNSYQHLYINMQLILDFIAGATQIKDTG